MFKRLLPWRARAAPLGCTAALATVLTIPSIRHDPRLAWSLAGAVAALIVWHSVLLLRAHAAGRSFEIDVVLRKQHYLQACVLGSLLLYWGWYWRPVYDQMPLIAAQLLFAYAFDMLLTWSRRDTYALGFGPFPVIFSINLFLWFKPEWFLLQFLMIAVGFAAKEFITWEKDGRRVHIFNPSSFPLALFSLVLIITSTTHHTLGQEIATTLEIPPHIVLWIFLVSLPGQYIFGVTTMTMSAVVTLYALGHLYFSLTGTYFFIDSYIPAAVFLGMHLLFTDPSTSPRTDLGRILFGVLYALSVAASYALLETVGAATFYDKLLAIPVLNLTIQALDRLARSNVLTRFDLAQFGRSLAPGRRNLAYMSVWVVAFMLINASEGVGDVRQSRGVPLWQRACDHGRRGACEVLATVLTQHCVEGSAWACNELGILTAEERGSSPLLPSDSFRRACDLGLPAGCDNEMQMVDGHNWRRLPPRPADYAILLQEEQMGDTVTNNDPLALFDRACSVGWAPGCYSAVNASTQTHGMPRDVGRALAYLRRACDLGMDNACRELTEVSTGDPAW